MGRKGWDPGGELKTEAKAAAEGLRTAQRGSTPSGLFIPVFILGKAGWMERSDSLPRPQFLAEEGWMDRVFLFFPTQAVLKCSSASHSPGLFTAPLVKTFQEVNDPSQGTAPPIPPFQRPINNSTTLAKQAYLHPLVKAEIPSDTPESRHCSDSIYDNQF